MTRAERRTYWPGHLTAWQAGNESQAACCGRIGTCQPVSDSQVHFS